MLAKIQSDLKDVIAFSDETLEKFLKLVPEQRAGVSRPTVAMLRSELGAALKQVDSALKNPPVRYDELISLAKEYAFLMQIKTSTAGAAREGGLLAVNWNRNQAGFIELVDAESLLRKFQPPRFYLPTFRGLSMLELAGANGDHLYPLGLSDRILIVDNQIKNSWNFFVHDMNHVAIQVKDHIKNPFFRLNSGPGREWRRKLISRIQAIPDSNQRVLLEILLFDLVHESGVPFHASALLDHLKNPNDVERLMASVQSNLSKNFYGKDVTERLRNVVQSKAWTKNYVSPFRDRNADTYLRDSIRGLRRMLE